MQGSQASAELLKARADRRTVSPLSVTSFSTPLWPPLHLSPVPSWPHGRSPVQVCSQTYTRKQNISTLPFCMQAVGTSSSLSSAVLISKCFLVVVFLKDVCLCQFTGNIPECCSSVGLQLCNWGNYSDDFWARTSSTGIKN